MFNPKLFVSDLCPSSEHNGDSLPVILSKDLISVRIGEMMLLSDSRGIHTKTHRVENTKILFLLDKNCQQMDP